MKRALLLATACLTLAGCGESSAPDTTQVDDATARGEVLGGTISDDMLPLDTLQSQSPPLEVEGEQGAPSSGNDQEVAGTEDAQDAVLSEDEAPEESVAESNAD